MRRRIMRWLVLVVLVALVPGGAQADTEISDWTGAKIRLTDGYVDNAGVKIHYHTAGEGPLVILIHGMGEYWFDWRDQIPSLAKQHKVVALSLRGTDRSDKPTAVEDYAVAKVASDIDAVIRHFGQQKATIMSYDSGGFFAWHFVLHYPERTERFVAIGSFHPANVIREYANNPAQQKVGQYSRNFQENPKAAADFAARRQDPNLPRLLRDTPETHKMRLEAAQRTSWEAVLNFYKANWPRFPYSPDMAALGGARNRFPESEGTDTGHLRPRRPPVTRGRVERSVEMGGQRTDDARAARPWARSAPGNSGFRHTPRPGMARHPRASGLRISANQPDPDTLTILNNAPAKPVHIFAKDGIRHAEIMRS